MPSTSALEIGFALAEPADVPVDVDVPADEGGAAAFPPAGVTPEACLEPKIADTMLPKMLIVASYCVTFFSTCTSPSNKPNHATNVAFVLAIICVSRTTSKHVLLEPLCCVDFNSAPAELKRHCPVAKNRWRIGKRNCLKFIWASRSCDPSCAHGGATSITLIAR